MTFDFRLKVFQTVARRLNFTRAAEELYITQPAVTRHIHEMEAHFKKQLFERKGTGIKLTNAGKTLLSYTDQLFDIYRKMEMDMAAGSQLLVGTLQLGASTTAANYVLPKYLAKFREKFESIHIELTTGNTEAIEKGLIENNIELGIVEGRSNRKELKYTRFLKDEIVLCTRTQNPGLRKNTISLKELIQLPLLMREQGSGTLDVIYEALKKAGIKPKQLNIGMRFESTESIKSYLLHSNDYAFLSINAILPEIQNNALILIEIKFLSIERYFYIAEQQGNQSPLIQLFIKFLINDNLKL